MAKKKLDRAKIAAKGWATRRAKAAFSAAHPATPKVENQAAAPSSDDILAKNWLTTIRSATSEEEAVRMVGHIMRRSRVDGRVEGRKEQITEHQDNLLCGVMASIINWEHMKGFAHAPLTISAEAVRAIKSLLQAGGYTATGKAGVYGDAGNRL